MPTRQDLRNTYPFHRQAASVRRPAYVKPVKRPWWIRAMRSLFGAS